MKVLYHHCQRFGGVTLSVHTAKADQVTVAIGYGSPHLGTRSSVQLSRHADPNGNPTWRVYHPVRFLTPSERLVALIDAFPLDLCWMPLLDALSEEVPEFERPVRDFVTAREEYARDRPPPAGD